MIENKDSPYSSNGIVEKRIYKLVKIFMRIEVEDRKKDRIE
jgi:hypothetical protein